MAGIETQKPASEEPIEKETKNSNISGFENLKMKLTGAPLQDALSINSKALSGRIFRRVEQGLLEPEKKYFLIEGQLFLTPKFDEQGNLKFYLLEEPIYGIKLTLEVFHGYILSAEVTLNGKLFYLNDKDGDLVVGGNLKNQKPIQKVLARLIEWNRLLP